MTFFQAAFQPLTRRSVDPEADHVEHESNSKIGHVVKLLDGGGTDLVREKVLERFATRISLRDNSDIVLTDNTFEADFAGKRDAATAASINAGLHTIASTMLFNRIAEIGASLFSNGSTYTYPDGDTFAADLASARNIALHDRRMNRLDLLATGIGSAGMLIGADVTGYAYQPFDPTKLWAVFGTDLDVGDSNARVDTTKIEHASVVVLELSGGEGRKRNYVAYLGRQDHYPVGRLVKYQAEKWSEIPEVGAGGYDWTTADTWEMYPQLDTIANPMTLHQDGESALYEYPIITWHMDSTGDGIGLLPVTGLALYDQVFELDVELSRDIEASGRSAAGSWILNNGSDVPVTGAINEGMTILGRDQTATLLSHSASNAREAMDVINSVAESTAKRYHIPGYMVSDKAAASITSGYMVELLNYPLVQDRKHREEINTGSMERKFEIEKQLVNFVEATTVIPLEASEDWNPAALSFPKDSADMIAVNEHLLKHNLTTVQELAVEMGKADTKEAAMNMIAENRAANPAPAQTGGRLGRALDRGQQ